MSADPESIKKEIQELQVKIEDLKRRMPAHSADMSMMVELEELEEKQDALQAELKALEVKN